MNFWKTMNTRWNEDEMKAWSSVRKTVYILFPLLVYFLIHDISEIILWAGLNYFMERASEQTVAFLNHNGYTIKGMINGTAILIGVAVIWRGVLAELKGVERAADTSLVSKKITKYMFLAALAFLSAVGLNVLLGMTGLTESSKAFAQTAKAQYGVDFWVGLVLYGLLSPFAEEAVFRGLIFNRMKRCFQYGIALVVSSLLFGCYHGNLVQAVYGSLLGLLMAYTYEKYESFAAPVLFHAVANVSIFAMTYQNGFSSISRKAAIFLAAGALLGAAGCLLYIKLRVPENSLTGCDGRKGKSHK